MKTLITAVTLAVVAASPAFARTRVHHHAAPASSDISAPYAASYGRDEVFMGNDYVGSDPDARIRLELRRDTLINGGS